MPTPQPREQQLAYALGGVTYLPHYTRKDRFVKPGCSRSQPETRTSKQLEAAGAQPVFMWLWPRRKSA